MFVSEFLDVCPIPCSYNSVTLEMLISLFKAFVSSSMRGPTRLQGFLKVLNEIPQWHNIEA